MLRKKVVVMAVFVVALVLGVFLIAPKPAEAAWCSASATWAGQRGWDGFPNPNYMVDFPIDSGQHTYYIYYQDGYVDYTVISPRNYDPSTHTTQFGLSTWWALNHSGWTDTSRWRIDYSC